MTRSRLGEIDAFYGDSHVLHNVSLRLVEGRLLALLGRNGAGKSTCMNVAVGLLRPRRGAVAVFGEAVTGRNPEDIAATGVALVPQGRRIFKSLTVRENLIVAARAPASGAATGWDLDRVAAAFPRLGERRNQVAGFLSGGEQQMLAIGRALMSNPRVLLMDEPSEGLAPTDRRRSDGDDPALEGGGIVDPARRAEREARARRRRRRGDPQQRPARRRRTGRRNRGARRSAPAFGDLLGGKRR